FDKQLKYNATPEWRSQFVNYEMLNNKLQEIHKMRQLSEKSPLLVNKSREDEINAFLRMYDDELTKVNSFFLRKEEVFSKRHEEIMNLVYQLVQTVSTNI